jgi:hypothetical protein
MTLSNGTKPSNELVIRTGPGTAKIALGIAGILLWMLMLTVLLAEIASGPKAARSSAAPLRLENPAAGLLCLP